MINYFNFLVKKTRKIRAHNVLYQSMRTFKVVIFAQEIISFTNFNDFNMRQENVFYILEYKKLQFC